MRGVCPIRALTRGLVLGMGASMVALLGCGTLLGIDDGLPDDAQVDASGSQEASYDGNLGEEVDSDDSSIPGDTGDASTDVDDTGDTDNAADTGDSGFADDGNGDADATVDAAGDADTGDADVDAADSGCVPLPGFCDGKCGPWVDNCGNSVTCMGCDGGACTDAGLCGGCTPNGAMCGPMVCGSVDNGCGLVPCGPLDGGCPSGGECDGGSCCTPEPLSQACAGRCNDVTVSDGCWGSMTCSGTIYCNPGQVCDPSTFTCCAVPPYPCAGRCTPVSYCGRTFDCKCDGGPPPCAASGQACGGGVSCCVGLSCSVMSLVDGAVGSPVCL